MTAVAAKEVTTRYVSAVRFGFYTEEEVKKLSVQRIYQPLILDAQRNPVEHGLYDPALGPTDKNARCTTCTLNHIECPGHFGHIELPLPVYNPMSFHMLYRMLRVTCHHCFHLKIDREEAAMYETKLALLCSGRLTDAMAMQVSRMPAAKELQELLEDFQKGGAGGGLLNGAGAEGRSSAGSKLTSLTLDAIRDTISELYTKVSGPKCRNCGAHNPQIKKQGGPMKIFRYWASAKGIILNAKAGIKIQSTLNRGQKELDDMEAAATAELEARVARKEHTKEDKKKGQLKSEDNGDDIMEDLKSDESENESEEQPQGDLISSFKQKQTSEKKSKKKGKKAMGSDEEEDIIAEALADREADEQQEGLDVDTATAVKEQMKAKYISCWEAQSMVQRVWQNEWRLLALMLGPGNSMWAENSSQQAGAGADRRAAAATGRRGPKGISVVFKGGRPQVRFSKEAEEAAKKSYSMFFVQVLAVPPNKFRPPSVMGDEMYEHPQNTTLQRILQLNLSISDIKRDIENLNKDTNIVDPRQVYIMELNRLVGVWTNLQDAVACLMDTTMAQNAPDKTTGIRQTLEKKEGLFRMNMMGKRVNFAARSVISPDPFIGTGEIGVPPYFAQRLCFPERVTPWNVERLREAVIRGPSQLGGAVAIEDGKGRLVNLKVASDKVREGLAKALLSATEGADRAMLKGAAQGDPSKGPFVGSNKIVYRHLRDGDLMLTNRQPTLHKPSLMAHRARVLKGEKTIRMHYANCATFNADFDGDEINLHFPQDHYGRAEGYQIVHADHQFIVPTDGKPVRGLIQDHVVSGVLLTKRDTFLTREEYTQLCFLACSSWRSKTALKEGPEEIEFEPPAMLKPKARWTGKQVISTVVRYYTHGKPPLTFSSGSKVPAEYWGGKASGEAELIFHKGYMVSGCIDKNQFGKFGLVHAVQEMYGGAAAGALLSSFSRLFTAYLQTHGFTCGFDDLLLNDHVERKRKEILSKAELVALKASAEIAGVGWDDKWTQQPDKYAKELQRKHAEVNEHLGVKYRSSRATGAAHDMKGSGVMHPLSSEVVKACIPAGQIKPFPTNCLSLMTVSGAKGSLVNFSQISCLLGQQELEGRRVPRMASGATLPCFAPYDGGARSCGFVGDRFLSGLRPQEYYFHCMAGREGLIDTTVKTSRSGYLQRCLVKNLETLRVHYDFTVRDNADGSIVQFFYGDDGLDVTQVSYMGQLSFLASNAPRFSQALDAPGARAAGRAARLTDMEEEVAEKLKKRAKLLAKVDEAAKAGDNKAEAKYKARLNEELPLMAQYPPSVLAATSEAFMDKVLKYLASNPDGVLGKKSKKGNKGQGAAGSTGTVDPEEFATLMRLKYMKSLAGPGEAVGVLAAQSVGEPSTQMTLNTFHMAGRGEANVTLGIPRLREILMTAATKIKTPVMTLPLKQGLTVTDAQVLAGRMRRLRLAECLESISVQEQPVCKSDAAGGEFGRAYMVTLQFFSPSQFPPEAELTFKELVEVFHRDFCPALKTAVDKEVRLKGGRPKSSLIGRVEKSQLKGEEEGDIGAPAMAGDEDGDGEVGGGGRGRAKRWPGQDRDGGQEGGGDDDDDAAEREEDAQEGKNQHRRAMDDEAEYEAPDEADQDATKEAAKESRKPDLFESSDSSSDDDEDDNDKEGDPLPATASAPKTPSKVPTAEKPSKGKKSAAKAAAGTPGGQGDLGDVGDRDVDYQKHTCRISLFLPLTAPKLLMLEVVEKVAAAVMVRHTPSIDKVYVLAGERGDGPRLQTDGVNFQAVWAHDDIVDVNGITTNDVAAMLRTYGVEAARATILKEVSSVFAAYGIGVDPRHLGLIADYMTHQGGYRGLNRIGIESNVSPFLKMSFETATHFLTDATLKQAQDDLLTPSARLCVGRVVEVGTGVMGIVHRFDDGMDRPMVAVV